MPAFVCRVAYDRGQVRSQIERAASEGELRVRLTEQGFQVYSIRPRPALSLAWKTGGAKKKVKLADFLVFNQQFVTLIRAGLPILKSLDLLATHIAQPSLRDCVNQVRASVRGGALLS